VQWWGELAGEQAAVKARLVDLHQRESTVEAGQATAFCQEERQLPTFTRASQNMAAVAAHLDMLPAPSIDGVGEVYRRLKNILRIVATQQRGELLIASG
jgi:hypothetical protein